MSKIKVFIILLFLYSLNVYAFSPVKENFCYTSPFISASIEPNVVVVMDYSGSMQYPAYTGCRADFYTSNAGMFVCNGNRGNPSSRNLVRVQDGLQLYDNTESYYGYFNSSSDDVNEVFYKYNDSEGYWYVKADCSDIQKSDGTCVAGNLLNWITTSRMDASLKALIGGKADSCDSTDCYITTQGSGSKWIHDTNMNCEFEYRAFRNGQTDSNNDENNGNYASHEWYLRVRNNNGTLDSGTCSIGTFGYRKMRVKVPVEDRIGVIQKNFNNVRFTFIAYQDTSDQGVIEFAVNDTNLSHLVSKFEDRQPYSGTPTNPGLDEAYDYLKQHNDHSNYNNSSYIKPGSESDGVDPYYGFFSDHWKSTRCRNSYVLLISDGEYTSNNNYGGDPDSIAHKLWSDDLRTLAPMPVDITGFSGAELRRLSKGPNFDGEQHAKVYALYAFSSDNAGQNSMKTIAAFGSYIDIDGCADNRPYLLSTNNTSTSNSSMWEACDNRSGATNAGNIDPCCAEWDFYNNDDRDNRSALTDGIPDNFFLATSGEEMEVALKEIFSDIGKNESASTSVATVTTQRRESAMAFQAYFHPVTADNSTDSKYYWSGKLRSFFTDLKSNMREDTDTNQKLNLKNDKIITFNFDEVSGKTFAFKYDDDDGDGIPDDCSLPTSEGSLAEISPIWDAALNLQNMSSPSSDRVIVYNNNLSNGDTINASNFTIANAETIKNYWDISTTEAIKLIKFIQGYDMPSNDDTFRRRSFSTNTSEHADGVEKLGDIINSTPKVVTSSAQNHYNAVYGDITYLRFIADTKVKDRKSVLIVGANDGMLHGFNAGKIVSAQSGDGQVSKIKNEFTSKELGDEIWAFIPKNALPYLKWYHQEDKDKHIPKIDYSFTLIDASINGSATDTKDTDSWRTLLVGTMGFGGKAIDVNDNGTDDYSSSIFVIDVTNPAVPKFMWEKSLPDRTLTTSMPAFTRLGDEDEEGSWHIVFGSGPQEPTAETFASAPSLFYFDLRTGTVETIPIPAADDMAIGNLLAVDADFDYITDVIYFGLYGEEGTVAGKLMKYQLVGNNADSFENILTTEAPVFASPEVSLDDHGKLWIYAGTGRFFNDDDKVDTVQQYMYGIVDIDDTWKGTNSYNNPVTRGDLFNSSDVEVIVDIQEVECTCNGVLTGEEASFSTDHYVCCEGSCTDQVPIVTEVYNDKIICSSTQKTFGVEILAEKITCYSGTNCISSSGCAVGGSTGLKGWYFPLENKERIYSKPFLTGTIIDVLTYIPDDDVCSFGGNTNLRAVYYKTGTPGSQPMFLSSTGMYDEDFSTTSKKAKISSIISLGKGAPPYGEAITALSPEEGTNKFTKMIQTSTGAVLKQQQQAKGLTNKKLFQITR